MNDCTHEWKEVRLDEDAPVSTLVCLHCGAWHESEYKGMRAVDDDE